MAGSTDSVNLPLDTSVIWLDLHGGQVWTRPSCPHNECGLLMETVRTPFVTPGPPLWLCPHHGNADMAIVECGGLFSVVLT